MLSVAVSRFSSPFIGISQLPTDAPRFLQEEDAEEQAWPLRATLRRATSANLNMRSRHAGACGTQATRVSDDAIEIAKCCDDPRTFAEHLSCSLKLLGFFPMHSDSQQCLFTAITRVQIPSGTPNRIWNLLSFA
jgi:hypothetical protein